MVQTVVLALSALHYSHLPPARIGRETSVRRLSHSTHSMAIGRFSDLQLSPILPEVSESLVERVRMCLTDPQSSRESAIYETTVLTIIGSDHCDLAKVRCVSLCSL